MGLHFTRPSKVILRARATLVGPMVAAGLAQAEIVRRTGLTQQWVSAWMKRQRPQLPQEPPNMRKRDPDARAILEVRRLSAIKAYQAGTSQAELARQFHVSRQTVMRWVHTFETGGPAALRRAPRTGRPSRVRSAAKTG